MSADTIACLYFVLFVFILFVFCVVVMFVYMMFTEDETDLIDDLKTFKEMIKE